jgi:hypothetical protein
VRPARERSIGSLYFFRLSIGITATASQVYMPLAAHLAYEQERGKVNDHGLIAGKILNQIIRFSLNAFNAIKKIFYCFTGI